MKVHVIQSKNENEIYVSVSVKNQTLGVLEKMVGYVWNPCTCDCKFSKALKNWRIFKYQKLLVRKNSLR